MPIEQIHNYDVEKFFKEIGHDYTDFIDYLNNKSKSPLIPDSTQYSAVYVINEFINSIQKSNLLQIKSMNTVKYYLSFLLRFKQYIDENHKDILFSDLNEILFNNFIQFTNQINESKLTHGSFNTYISIIRRMCTFAVENDYTIKNINYKFNKISYTTLPRYLSHHQINEIIIETNNNKNAYLWRTIFITLLGTGLRIHELVNLQIKDFDIEDKLISTIGKGKKERNVPIYPEVEKAVLNYLKQSNVNDIRFASGYLFSRQFGNNRQTPVSIRSIQYNFQKIAQKIKLDSRFTVHSFRHTFAVNCLKADMPLVYLCQVLGHSSPSTTAIYTQLLPQDLQQIVNEKFPIPLEKLIKQLLS